MKIKWPCGTPRSQGNAFDWRSQPASKDWVITSQRTEAGAKGAAVTAPKLFHIFQKAVK